MLIQLGIFAAALAGLWKTFEKAGRQGWEGIVPIYNMWILVTEILKKPWIWFVLLLIPFVNLVIFILLMIELAKAFEKGTGFGVGLALLGFIFFPILGFGDAKFIGVQPGGFTLPIGPGATPPVVPPAA